MQIDLLVLPRWLVPIEPAGTVLEQHALAVDAGRIVAVLPAAEARAQFQARETAHDRFVNTFEIHTDEADRIEISQRCFPWQ